MPCSDITTGVPCRHLAAIATSMLRPFMDECTRSTLGGRADSGRSRCSISHSAPTASASVIGPACSVGTRSRQASTVNWSTRVGRHGRAAGRRRSRRSRGSAGARTRTRVGLVRRGPIPRRPASAWPRSSVRERRAELRARGPGSRGRLAAAPRPGSCGPASGCAAAPRAAARYRRRVSATISHSCSDMPCMSWSHQTLTPLTENG